MNLEKLKETARRFEQKEDWRKAIDVYLKAIHQVEEGTETAPDLSLYNRIGDLYLKIADTPAAVRSYERAVDLYADQGFFNNAIALCGKILRVNPGRTQTYLKLAQLHARKNVVIEAKRNLIEFLERMNALGQLDQAFQSVKAFADQFSGSQEIRMMLVDLLRAASREDEAREQLEKLAQELEAVGDTAGARRTRERLQAIDHDDAAAPAPSAPAAAATTPRAGDLVFLDTGFSPVSPAPTTAPADPAPGLVPTAQPMDEPMPVDEVPPPPLAGLQTMDALDVSDAVRTTSAGLDPLVIERVEPAEMDFEGGRLEGMEGTPLELPDAVDENGSVVGDTAADGAVGREDTGAMLDFVVDEPSEGDDPGAMPELELAEPLDLDLELDSAIGPEHGAGSLAASAEVESATSLTFLDTGASNESEPGLTSLEDRVLDDPDNPALHRDLADALFAADQPERALDELELALAGYEAREAWVEANGIVDRFLAVYPDSIRHHQKRVELAYRTGDREPLIGAYLGLGDALARTGAIEKAVAVFRRVQEHDPGNVRAATALAVLVYEPPARPAPPASPGEGAGPLARPAVPGAAASAPTPELELEPEPAPASDVAASPPSVPPSPSPALPPARADEAAFVDFGAMVLDEQGPRDTRMHVDRAEPTGHDEQREFREILEQFKRGIAENLGDEDYDAHYDLGLAFKEMGLLDEAIAEFQRAARAPASASRLRASEALGVAFYDKGQHPVAEAVLRRALHALDGGDEAKIGLLYWLGRAAEAQGKDQDAIASYERALAVDIRFMDLGERLGRLTAERRP